MKHKIEDCVQSTPIALLIKDQENMAWYIKDIKVNIKDIKKSISNIENFMLTSPQKFADKNEYDKYKLEIKKWQDSINLKIASATAWFWVVIYILNKIL